MTSALASQSGSHSPPYPRINRRRPPWNGDPTDGTIKSAATFGNHRKSARTQSSTTRRTAAIPTPCDAEAGESTVALRTPGGMAGGACAAMRVGPRCRCTAPGRRPRGSSRRGCRSRSAQMPRRLSTPGGAGCLTTRGAYCHGRMRHVLQCGDPALTRVRRLGTPLGLHFRAARSTRRGEQSRNVDEHRDGAAYDRAHPRVPTEGRTHAARRRWKRTTKSESAAQDLAELPPHCLVEAREAMCLLAGAQRRHRALATGYVGHADSARTPQEPAAIPRSRSCPRGPCCRR